MFSLFPVSENNMEKYLYRDGVHPSELGTQLYAQVLYGQMVIENRDIKE